MISQSHAGCIHDYAPHPELVTNLGEIPGATSKNRVLPRLAVKTGPMACLMKPEAKKNNIPLINMQLYNIP
jgi:hypothetical protein